MPLYLFEHPTSGRQQWVSFSMREEKKFVDEKGVAWKRVYVNPQMSVDTKCDPYSEADFVKATNKKGTMGDLYDRSQELHLKRKDKNGRDPFRDDYYRRYSEKHKGKKHYLQQREETAAKLKDVGLGVEYPDNT